MSLRHLILSLALCLMGTAAATAQPPSKTVNMDVANADFHAVVALLARQTGVDVTIREGGAPYKPVTVRLEKAPLAEAVREVARRAHARLTRGADGGYLFEPRDAGHQPVNAPRAAPPPKVPINPADLRWSRLALRHAVASDILGLMHWDAPAPLGRPRPRLPEGVAAILALPQANGLLVRATPQGLEQVRQIVKIVDIARFAWTMTVSCWAADVGAGEAAGLGLRPRHCAEWTPRSPGGPAGAFMDRPVDVATGDAPSALLRALTAAGRAAPLTMTHREASAQRWRFGGFDLGVVRLNSDDSVTVVLEAARPDSAPTPADEAGRADPLARLTLRRGGVVALRPPGGRRVLFLQADY